MLVYGPTGHLGAALLGGAAAGLAVVVRVHRFQSARWKGASTDPGIAAEPATRPVAYHDPCSIGRHNGVYDPPRELIGALPGAGAHRDAPARQPLVLLRH